MAFDRPCNLTIVLSFFDWFIKVSEQFYAVPLLAACVFLLTKQAFKLNLKYFQKIIKQLLNSVLAGYEELFGRTQTSALIIPHLLLDLIQ